jgi:hypothetical protein
MTASFHILPIDVEHMAGGANIAPSLIVIDNMLAKLRTFFEHPFTVDYTVVCYQVSGPVLGTQS